MSLSVNSKLIRTLVLWIGLVSLEVSRNLFGPSLISLDFLFHTNTPTISKLFLLYALLYMLGALCGGVSFDFINREFALGFLLIFLGLSISFIPWIAPSLYLLFLLIAVLGFTSGAYDTGIIAWLIEMWGKESEFYIQLENYIRSASFLLSSLLVTGFLPTENHLKLGNLTNSEAIDKLNALIAEESTDLTIPFMVSGSIAMFGSIAIFTVYFILKYDQPGLNSNGENGAGNSESELWSKRHVLLIMLTGIFMGNAEAVEQMIMQFLPSFTYFNELHFTQQKSAFILSAFTAGVVIFGGIGVYISTKVRPEQMIQCLFVFIFIGNTLLLLSEHSELFLWSGIIITSMGTSPLYATSICYISQYFQISNMVAAMMLIAGGSFGGLYPTIIGTFIEDNPFILIYLVYLILILIVSIFFVIRYLVWKFRRVGLWDDMKLRANEGKPLLYGKKTFYK